MHAATKSYVPSPGIVKRMQWEEEELLTVEKYIPKEDQLIVKNTKDLLNLLHTLPKNRDNYGLIHTDIHSGNFFMTEKIYKCLILMTAVIIGSRLISPFPCIIQFYISLKRRTRQN